MAYTPSSQFHGYLDAKTRNYQVYKRDRGWTTTTTEKHITIQERTLSYQFHSHFHPYMAELVRRLIDGSVRGLQAVDTEWGTPARLTNQTQAELPGGKPQPVILSADEVIRLPDGAVITLSNGTSAKYCGNLLINPSDGSSVTLPDNAQVTLPASTLVRRSNGASVILISDTPAILTTGRPRLTLYEDIYFPGRYNPNPELVDGPYPVKDLDFTSSGAYSAYNWELFFHVPMTIAIHLSKNQRFGESMRWFHYIFDPTDDSEGPTPERFWKVKPFQYTDVKLIEEILVNLSTGADPALRQDTINSIGAWKDSPFRPHVVARYRQSAYMFKTVMAYLDNLIDWGNSLFRQDTGESINEATQLYVLAANILGPRPQAVPKKGSVRPQTYANLKKDLDALGNAQVELEADIPFDLLPHPNEAAENDQLNTLNSIGKALYFCVPRNDRLLTYWDTVADRLFKIRNSLNIQGIFRQLPLFEPPIDPTMLARAAAAGLDVSAIVNGINQPLPLVRFQLLVQKAADICQEVKSLGNNLLSAMEKEDGEAMAILRARHERIVMEMVEHVRYAQLQEAIKSKEGLLTSLALAVQRYTYHERQLGKKVDEVKKAIPDLGELDKDSLDKMKFAMKEAELAPRELKWTWPKTSMNPVARWSAVMSCRNLINWKTPEVCKRPLLYWTSLGKSLVLFHNLVPKHSLWGGR